VSSQGFCKIKISFYIGIGQVIQGWDGGVMTMKVGEKRRLYIPSALGYGARGAGSAIPPHANLIFDVELLKVSQNTVVFNKSA
jgi:FKBP-type peptidyl-prolyl cis-trans isomerase